MKWLKWIKCSEIKGLDIVKQDLEYKVSLNAEEIIKTKRLLCCSSC